MSSQAWFLEHQSTGTQMYQLIKFIQLLMRKFVKIVWTTILIHNFSTNLFYTDVHLHRHIKMLLLMLYMYMYHFYSFLVMNTLLLWLYFPQTAKFLHSPYWLIYMYVHGKFKRRVLIPPIRLLHVYFYNYVYTYSCDCDYFFFRHFNFSVYSINICIAWI